MFWYQALILGVVQGLTEFLPISSSGHLVVLPILFGWDTHPLVFDLILHLGTITALMVYFKTDLLNILRSLNKELSKEKPNAKKYSYEGQLGIFILLGSVPAALLGYFFEDIIEESFRGLLTVSILLTAGSLLMILAERETKKRSLANTFNGVTGSKAIIIGFFQSLALFPGFSRSGATISGGMLMGLTRDYAARFSFLLSIPIVIGAATFKILGTSNADLAEVGLIPMLVGFGSSFFVGYLAIDFLLKFLRSRTLSVFIVYRVILAVVLLAFYFNLL